MTFNPGAHPATPISTRCPWPFSHTPYACRVVCSPQKYAIIFASSRFDFQWRACSMCCTFGINSLLFIALLPTSRPRQLALLPSFTTLELTKYPFHTISIPFKFAHSQRCPFSLCCLSAYKCG